MKTPALFWAFGSFILFGLQSQVLEALKSIKTRLREQSLNSHLWLRIYSLTFSHRCCTVSRLEERWALKWNMSCRYRSTAINLFYLICPLLSCSLDLVLFVSCFIIFSSKINENTKRWPIYTWQIEAMFWNENVEDILCYLTEASAWLLLCARMLLYLFHYVYLKAFIFQLVSLPFLIDLANRRRVHGLVIQVCSAENICTSIDFCCRGE